VLVPVVINGQVVPVAIPRETAAITAQAQTIYTRLILRPRLTVISGEEHEIFVGENVPILTASTNATAADPLQTSQNIERQDVGVVLRVTPTLGELGSIVLELQVEVSALAPSQAGNIRQVGPTIRERVLTSTVRLESDRVAMIGWQSGPVQQLLRTGVPWLRDIPILGFLFQASEERTLENNLLISVTAWSDDTEVRALREMLRNAMGVERGEKVPELGERP
jgi:general secretion pathway protein D